MKNANPILVLFMLLGIGAIGPCCAEQADSIEMQSPPAGWLNSKDAHEEYTQSVNYPAAQVNTPALQAKSATIAGQIKRTPKPDAIPARQTGKLVVNGVDMPLDIQPDGRFSRPYSFPPGSNNIEIRSEDGQLVQRYQYYDAYQQKTKPKLRILLAWDSPNTDLDLHVVSPDGEHVWYGNRVAKNGGAQDVDVTTGYGPEIYSSPEPPRGTYLVYVNYFGGGYDMNGNAQQIITTATITVISDEASGQEKQQRFVIPMREPGELALVKAFEY